MRLIIHQPKKKLIQAGVKETKQLSETVAKEVVNAEVKTPEEKAEAIEDNVVDSGETKENDVETQENLFTTIETEKKPTANAKTRKTKRRNV